MPVFEFMKAKKNISGANYSFESWKNNLTFELKKGTSILNISYRDKNRDLTRNLRKTHHFSRIYPRKMTFLNF